MPTNTRQSATRASWFPAHDWRQYTSAATPILVTYAALTRNLATPSHRALRRVRFVTGDWGAGGDGAGGAGGGGGGDEDDDDEVYGDFEDLQTG